MTDPNKWHYPLMTYLSTYVGKISINCEPAKFLGTGLFKTLHQAWSLIKSGRINVDSWDSSQKTCQIMNNIASKTPEKCSDQISFFFLLQHLLIWDLVPANFKTILPGLINHVIIAVSNDFITRGNCRKQSWRDPLCTKTKINQNS